ncbi:MAG: uroporphyrinogen-III synthase [Xanthomonadales bacterium]|nr:uroporphyrinogen-III synthase [Xanthomonadales bacterium]
MTPSLLQGWLVISLRPAGQARQLRRWLQRNGAGMRNLPLLQLRARAIDRNDRDAVATTRYWLFTSPASVRFARQQLPELFAADGALARAAAEGKVFAPGPGTAAILAGHGITPVAIPAGSYDSEGLLALPGLAAPHDGSLALVGAPHGRGLLAPSLRERGAQVHELHVYQRLPARLPARRLAAVPADRARTALIVTSGRMLERLVQVLPAQRLDLWRRQLPLILASQRLADLAGELGFAHRHVAGSAMTADLQTALLALAAAGSAPAHGR